MAEVTVRPYEVFARIGAGAVHLHARTMIAIDGVDVKENDPEPLAGMDDPVLAQFATLFSASAVSQRDRAMAERDSAYAELSTLRGELAQAKSQIERLQTLLEPQS